MAKDVSTMSFKNDKTILLPMYMEKRITRIKIEDVPPMLDIGWIAETMIYEEVISGAGYINIQHDGR